MVSEIEALPEAARRDTLMQHLRALLLAFLTGDQKRAAVVDQFDLALGKASDRPRNAILVLALFLDVVGGPVGPNALVEHIEQPVEADRSAIVGGKVERSHSHILH